MIKELITKNRSYRRYDGTYKIEKSTMIDLVELARLSPFARNLQSLKFAIYNEPDKLDLIFSHISFAGAIPNKGGTPIESERPTGYILIINDTSIGIETGVNAGIAMQSILLGAVEQGLGGCMFASVRAEELKRELSLPENYNIIFAVALGKPIETVVIEKMEQNNISYWRTEDKVHHVPKRSIEEVLY